MFSIKNLGWLYVRVCSWFVITQAKQKQVILVSLAVFAFIIYNTIQYPFPNSIMNKEGPRKYFSDFAYVSITYLCIHIPSKKKSASNKTTNDEYLFLEFQKRTTYVLIIRSFVRCDTYVIFLEFQKISIHYS